MPGRIEGLRQDYHRRLCRDVLRQTPSGIPNNADSGSAASVRLGKELSIGLVCP